MFCFPVAISSLGHVALPYAEKAANIVHLNATGPPVGGSNFRNDGNLSWVVSAQTCLLIFNRSIVASCPTTWGI